MDGGAGMTIDWPGLIARGCASGLVRTGIAPTTAGIHCGGTLAYLAVPYAREVAIRDIWRPERSVRIGLEAAWHQAALLRAGVASVCTVVARDAMCTASLMLPEGEGRLDPMDRALWRDVAGRLLGAAGAVIVPAIDGWDRCPDVLAEAVWALAHNRPVLLYGGV